MGNPSSVTCCDFNSSIWGFQRFSSRMRGGQKSSEQLSKRVLKTPDAGKDFRFDPRHRGN